MLWACQQERRNEMDTNPTVWLLWMVTVRTERKTKRKEKARQPQRRWRYDTRQRSCQKTSKQAWKHCQRRHRILWRLMGRLFLNRFFLKLHNEEIFQGTAVTFTLLPPFPKHDKQMKEPSKGWCKLGYPLSFYLPSPHTSLLCSFPTTWLKFAP